MIPAAQPFNPSIFPRVLTDSTEWNKIPNLEEQLYHNPLGEENRDFLIGIATCTYQDSGSFHCPDSQWPDHEQKCLPSHNRSHLGPNLFELYKTAEGRQELIVRLLELGVNTYRFSVEWSHIEPQEGIANGYHLQIYVDLCKSLRDNGIKPMVTLHHFSEPSWFHARGSFENEKNIPAFVEYAKFIYTQLTAPYKGEPLVDHFCTINEPAIEAFSRYVRGAYSPGVKMDFNRAGKFLENALIAHCIVYPLLKTISKGPKIGIIHQYLRFVPSNFLLKPIAAGLNALVNDAVLNFFKTGVFYLHVPMMCFIERNHKIKPLTDFVGVQYYGRPVVGFTGSTSFSEQMTKMPFREDPEGLCEAIVETHKAFNVPVIITENGISTDDEVQRARYLTRALYATKTAQTIIGHKNVIGYVLWSLNDNFEWDMGMDPQRFGAFQLIREEGKPTRIASQCKPGMLPFINMIQALAKARLKQARQKTESPS